MADNEKSEDEKTLDGGNTQNHQSDQSENSEKMLRPWMKNLGKKFYDNKTLGKFETLPEAVEALLNRPEPKDVPESYGESESIEKAYKDAGLTKKEAEAISAAFKPLMKETPPDLKEAFGDKYDSTMADYGKGIGSFADDLKDRIEKKGWDKDPYFVSIMSRIGKETGGDHFDKPKDQEKPKSAIDEYIDQIIAKKG